MLVAIEGIDGSGKGTQADLLAKRFVRVGLPIELLTFPNYGGNPFGVAVGRYLNGDFGGVDQVAPELAALLFAGDRFVSRQRIREKLETGTIVLCDRYVASNLAHQAAKLPPVRREDFLLWLTSIEYGLYAMPRPTLTVYLDIPVAVAGRLIAKKSRRTYTDLKADIHERDQDYLARCQEVYRTVLTSAGVERLVTVPCCDSEHQLRTPEEIHADIWSHVAQLLASPT